MYAPVRSVPVRSLSFEISVKFLLILFTVCGESNLGPSDSEAKVPDTAPHACITIFTKFAIKN